MLTMTSRIMNVAHQGQDLVIGNVGDSRAVLATRDKENSLTAVQLTVDLKPNLPSKLHTSRTQNTHKYIGWVTVGAHSHSHTHSEDAKLVKKKILKDNLN